MLDDPGNAQAEWHIADNWFTVEKLVCTLWELLVCVCVLFVCVCVCVTCYMLYTKPLRASTPEHHVCTSTACCTCTWPQFAIVVVYDRISLDKSMTASLGRCLDTCCGTGCLSLNLFADQRLHTAKYAWACSTDVDDWTSAVLCCWYHTHKLSYIYIYIDIDIHV